MENGWQEAQREVMFRLEKSEEEIEKLAGKIDKLGEIVGSMTVKIEGINTKVAMYGALGGTVLAGLIEGMKSFLQ